MQNDAHVVVNGLSVSYVSGHGKLHVLQGFDMTTSANEFISVVGTSGCGKTTLLRAIGGLLSPDDGTILIGGEEPETLQQRKGIGFVSQDPSLLPWLTVEENVRLSQEINSQGPSEVDTRRLLEMVGLAEFHAYRPRELSGGMKQRVALARALAVAPELLLLDEPLAALDEITRSAMRYEILRLWEKTRSTAIMVTHSIVEAVAMSDRVLVLTGPPGALNGEVPISLPRPRDSLTERTEAFQGLVEQIQTLVEYGGPNGTRC